VDKLKQWVALTVVGCLAILAGGWFLLVSPKRTEAADVRAEAASQQQTNASLREQLKILQAQAKELPKKQADLARVAAKIPDNPALPSLIRALTAASTSAGVELVSVTPGAPSAVGGAAQPVAAAQPAAAQPAAGQPAAAPAQPAAPTSAGTLAQIPIDMTVVGGYFEVSQFLANLENLPRALRVSDLGMAPGDSPTRRSSSSSSTSGQGTVLSTTISGTVFMAANRPAAAPLTAPAK
jgi:type IV pilus assembly protein PilO